MDTPKLLDEEVSRWLNHRFIISNVLSAGRRDGKPKDYPHPCFPGGSSTRPTTTGRRNGGGADRDLTETPRESANSLREIHRWGTGKPFHERWINHRKRGGFMKAMTKEYAASAFLNSTAVTEVAIMETVRIRVVAGALPTLKGISDKERKNKVRAERQQLINEIFAQGDEIRRRWFPAFNLELVVVRPSIIEGEASEITIHPGRDAEKIYKRGMQP